MATQVNVAVAIVVAFLVAGVSIVQSFAQARQPNSCDIFKPGLPTIWIFAFGGTMTGLRSSASSTPYASGVIPIWNYIKNVPGLCDIANIRARDVFWGGSEDSNATIFQELASRIWEDQKNHCMDGIILTHGTDLMESHAYLIDLIYDGTTPICMVGAMRTDDAPSRDGPESLLSAASVVVDKNANGRGVMVMSSGKLIHARHVRKVHANNLDSFDGGDAGNVGLVVDNKPWFFFPPSRPLRHHAFAVSRPINESLARVLRAEQISGRTIYRLLREGVEGLVVEGYGAGYLSSEQSRILTTVLKDLHNFPVVVSSRVQRGIVQAHNYPKGIGAGDLTTDKSRILLAACLTNGYSWTQINSAFAHGTQA
ncbi:hypothetical protein FSARC_1867 [Fusarium sarcochroum]|uniref:asparaginase n=1 Tax=Fusarium sarcochroum TaxID=1208366 RepID=A0A8H4U7X6_9HYPO|nr:hypothetical protein FSARC_1867 [Fusarium sarcochroum]